jgi:CheY-like chemotaxis protein
VPASYPQPEGAPFELLPEVANSYAPVWSPDGTRVLATVTNPNTRQPDWWIAPLSGDAPVHTSLGDDLRGQGFNHIATNAWLDGDWIVFTGRIGETQTLWKVRLRSDGSTASRAMRATTNEAGDSEASFAAGPALGHCADVAFDGPSALETVPAFHPDVVLLDLGLPVMDGFEVAQRLKALPGWEGAGDRRHHRVRPGHRSTADP